VPLATKTGLRRDVAGGFCEPVVSRQSRLMPSVQLTTHPPHPPSPAAPVLLLALALSLSAAISLGITRFSYGLLLPPMREDLGWSYTLAGAMNTANAVGYLIGALAMSRLVQRRAPTRVLLWGSVLATLLMAASGFFTASAPLLVQRLLAGVASALVFSTGGLLAARLAAQQPHRSGFLLGLYYGGTGLGIVLSALGVPLLLAWAAGQAHAWAWAWWGLAGLCALATALLVWPARVLAAQEAVAGGVAVVAGRGATRPSDAMATRVFRFRDFGFALAGYACFGVGYIGYMTFVIALLREQGSGASAITVYFTLLGLAVMASSRIWAGLLDRHKSGRALALLNALLGVATLLPAVTMAWPLVIASGLLFGGVFLSVVASTTALVRHNLPPNQWVAGIGAFTVAFAAGQIVGPTVVGFIADGPGGLARGLVFSAVALWVGAGFAWRQRAL
jgi:predicted MFS family arabinose efflux permease